MAGKMPAFQFYPGDWRRDTQVQMATMETRGVWFEMICCMWDSPDRGKISGDIQQLARMLGCDTNVLSRSLVEIERLKIADVTNGHKEITIVNRRMSREQKVRDDARLRKVSQRKREAGHKDVTSLSSSSPSSSTSKPIIKEKKDVTNNVKYREFVSMTESSFTKLVETHGLPKTEKMLDVLDNYKGSTGKKYKCDYRAILSWVIDRVNQDSVKAGSGIPPPEAMKKPVCGKCKQEESVGHNSDTGLDMCAGCWPRASGKADIVDGHLKKLSSKKMVDE
jgi:hypothetical protein